MTSTTQLIVDLTLLLATSVIAGEIANRVGQAALVGQLIVGVVLGPSLIGPFIGLSILPPELASVQILATVFILFMAGLEVKPEQIYGMGGWNLAFGVMTFAYPFGITAFVARILFPALPLYTQLFIALTLSITALPVMGIMLTEFGLIRSSYGRLLMNTALINELVALSTFAVLDELQSGKYGGWVAFAIAVVSVALFLLVMLSIHMSIRALRQYQRWDGIRRWFAGTWRSRSGGFAILMIFILCASVFSQYLGLTYVIGSFYAGILVTEQSAGREGHRTISTIFDTMSWGFFVPLFFVLVGLQMNLRDLESAWDLLLLVSLFGVAFLSKLSTGYAFGRGLGWRDPDAMAIGYLISSRGAVELAMCVILLQEGIFTPTLFTFVAGVGLLTTIVAPIGALRSWEADARTREELYQRMPSLRPGQRRSRAWQQSFPYGPLAEHVERPAEPPLPSAPSLTPPLPESAGAPTPEPSRPPLPKGGPRTPP